MLITSIGETHAEYTLACIAAGKPVLCEKPLAPTTAECEQVLDAEVAHGTRLVVVGYMRRYDPGYQQVKASLEGGAIGVPLMLHNVHRNSTVPESYTSFMTMTDSMIHEVDTTPLAAGRGDRRRPGHPHHGVRRRRSRISRTRSSPSSRPSPGSCPRSSSSPTASTATTSAASSLAPTARRRCSTRSWPGR